MIKFKKVMNIVKSSANNKYFTEFETSSTISFINKRNNNELKTEH